MLVKVINLRNPNALITMVQVSKNADNPYFAFCEYIKYCLFSIEAPTTTITELKKCVADEFGIDLPNNILVKCLMYIQNDGIAEHSNHQIVKKGQYDVAAFDRERKEYRQTEQTIIDSLVQFVARYNRVWSEEHAREVLIKVLDQGGLAYEIFLYDKNNDDDRRIGSSDINTLSFLPVNEESMDAEQEDNQSLFSDEHFVGMFIEEILSSDSNIKDYLIKVCEGLMLCVGAYQLPSADNEAAFPQIKGTDFFFDTKLLLRFLGCASKPAVESARELVSMIQKAGGNICYYPQTFQEISSAFEKACSSIHNNFEPSDSEMRFYLSSINYNDLTISAKAATFRKELEDANIYYRDNRDFSDNERLKYGFDNIDFQNYLYGRLSKDQRVVENDALSIWETHMLRKGNYNEYCGTRDRLPVFVTTNTRLVEIALEYRANRNSTKEIQGWKRNRLPVITDMRLTCRLWSPALQGRKLSLLYLAANAVAAKRPTKAYTECIRKLAIQLKDKVPLYENICFSEFFDDKITNAFIKKDVKSSKDLDIAMFASTVDEIAFWKVRELEKEKRAAYSDLSEANSKFEQQTQDIIDGAVDKNINNFGWVGFVLRLILWWPVFTTLLFAGVSSLLSYVIGNWSVLWAVGLPILVAIVEQISSSKFVVKRVLKCVFPKAEAALNLRISKNLHKAELPYKDRIIQLVKQKNHLWSECVKIVTK